MALTPEDVVNKRFQPTKFREGYDQDEVDDFLDEVVVELRRLNQENEELRQRQGTGGAEAAESHTAGTPAGADESTAAPVVAAPGLEQAGTPVSDIDDETASTSSLLQLARRLHEEHVREGMQRRDALIAEGEASAARIAAEGEANAARIAAEGEANAARIAAEAEAQQQSAIDALDSERQVLERRIDELRTFEREYRENLKSYIEGQLRNLDADENNSSGDEIVENAHQEHVGSTSGRQDLAGS